MSKYSRAYKIRYRGGILNEIRERGCPACGEKDADVIEFHHVNPEEKEGHLTNYGKLSNEAWAIELSKCAPLCANCHLRAHKGKIDASKYQVPLDEAQRFSVEYMQSMRLTRTYICGEDHPNNKTTAEEKWSIREEYAKGGTSYAKMAQRYGLAKNTIIKIIKG